MKLNLANPNTGLQKQIEIDDERQLLPFFEKRIGAEVSGDTLGSEFEGAIFRITGGSDKDGFPMMQGVLTNGRVRLLFKDSLKKNKIRDEITKKGKSGSPSAQLAAAKAQHSSACLKTKSHFIAKKSGQMVRKSIRGCIVGPDLALLNLVLVTKGKNDIVGLTDGAIPRRLGPKRATKIRKLFNLDKKADVRDYLVARTIMRPNGKTKKKTPKIQRLISSTRLQRKRRAAAVMKQRHETAKQAAAEYAMVLQKYKQEKTTAAASKTKVRAKK